MKLKSLALAIFLPVLLSPAIVKAGEVAAATPSTETIECEQPLPGSVETNPPKNYCDIYTRQLAYRKETLKYKDTLMERQKNFDAPRADAFHAYEKNKEALNAERSKDEDGND